LNVKSQYDRSGTFQKTTGRLHVLKDYKTTKIGKRRVHTHRTSRVSADCPPSP